MKKNGDTYKLLIKQGKIQALLFTIIANMLYSICPILNYLQK